MASIAKFVSVPSKTLAASINSSATTIQVSDIKGWDGVNLTSASFGAVLWCVLRDSTNTFMELMQLDPTTIANSSITILKRGLDFSGGSTEVAANKLTWIKNDTIVELGSNPPQTLQSIKDYIDGVALAGTVNATSILQGLVQLPTSSQINSGTALGSTGAALTVTPDTLAASNYGLNLPSNDQKLFLGGVTGMLLQYAGSAAPSGFLLCDGSAVSRTTYAALFAVISTSYGVGDGATTFNVPDGRGRSFVGAGTGTKIATISSIGSSIITATGLTNAANNEFQTGQPVVFAATVAGNLSNGATYYVIRVTNTTFSLASSLANAQSGTVISLAGTETGHFTLTLTARTRGDTGGEETHAMSSTELLSHTHSELRDVINSGGVRGATTVTGASATDWPTTSAGGNAAMNAMQPFFVGNWIIKI